MHIETYEDAKALGIAAREQKDAAQWALGEVAYQWLTRNPDTLQKDFAYDIGIDPDRLSEYKVMATFYRPAHRLIPLSYTSYRTAKRYAHTPEEAVKLLEECVDNDWNTGRFAVEMKKRFKGLPLPPQVAPKDYSTEYGHELHIEGNGEVVYMDVFMAGLEAASIALTPTEARLLGRELILQSKAIKEIEYE